MSRLRKVAAGARIHDADTAASLGLVALFLFDEDSGRIRDLVSGTSTPLTSGGVGRSEAGRVLTFNGSQATNMALRLPETPGATDMKSHAANFSVLGRFMPLANAATDPAAIFGVYDSTAQAGFGVGWNASAAVGATALHSGASTLARSAGALNNWYTVYASVRPAGIANAWAWIDGKPATTAQGASVPNGAGNKFNEISVGAQHRSSGFLRNANGQLEWGAVLYGNLLSDAAAFDLYTSDFPYNLLTPRRRYYLVPAAGGPAAALEGAATGSGVATGVLTTAIALAGVTTGTGTAAAVLSTTITFAGATTGAGTATGALTTGIALVGAATGVGTAAADLTAGAGLSGAASGSGTTTGSLTTGIALAASIVGAGVATGMLTTAIALAGAATGSGAVTGTLTTALALVGAATGVGTATGDLTATSAGLIGAATGSGIALGDLTTGIALVGAATGSGVATASLSVPGSFPTAAEIAAEVWNTFVVEAGLSAAEILRVLLAVAAGKTAIDVGPPVVVTFRDQADTIDRVRAEMTGSERDAVTIDGGV